MIKKILQGSAIALSVLVLSLAVGVYAQFPLTDISDETNLAVDAPITLTDDTVGLDEGSISITESQISDLDHWDINDFISSLLGGYNAILGNATTTNLYVSGDLTNAEVQANTASRHDAVTLAGTPDYLTIAGQVITRGLIDLATDITGTLDESNIDSSIARDSEVVWEQYNGMGIRPKTSTNTALIGGTASTTESTLEVQGSINVNNGTAGLTFDVWEAFGGMFHIPRITSGGSLGVVGVDGALIALNKTSADALCQTTDPCFGLSNLASTAFVKFDTANSDMVFSGADTYTFENKIVGATIEPNGIIDSDGNSADGVNRQILTGLGNTTKWQDTAELASKWATTTAGGLDAFHPSISFDTLTLGNTTPLTGVKLSITGDFNLTSNTNKIKLNNNDFISICGASTNFCAGLNTGSNRTSFTNNTMVGSNAGLALTSGSQNAFFGGNAGRVLTTSSNSTVLGYDAVRNGTLLDDSVVIGYQALFRNDHNEDGFYGGKDAGFYATTSINTVAIGIDALEGTELYGQRTGTQMSANTAVGAKAMQLVTTDFINSTALGYEAGRSNGANHNLFLGYQAGRNGTTGSQNVYAGAGAGLGGASNSCQNNVALGYISFQSCTSGSQNVALGVQSLFSNTTGNSNMAIGGSALFDNITGIGNVAVGTSGLEENTAGDYNVGIGTSALLSSQGDHNVGIGRGVMNVMESGNGNVGVGYQVGNNVTAATSSIIIGYDIDFPQSTADKILNIGNLIFGTGLDGTGTTLASGNVGIGKSSPTTKLDVEGTASSTNIATGGYATEYHDVLHEGTIDGTTPDTISFTPKAGYEWKGFLSTCIADLSSGETHCSDLNGINNEVSAHYATSTDTITLDYGTNFVSGDEYIIWSRVVKQ